MSLIVFPLALLWPAAIAFAFPDGRRRVVGWAALVILLAACVGLAALTVRVATSGPVDVVAGGWPVDVGIRLRADALGAIFALLSCSVVTAAFAHAVITDSQPRLMPTLTLFMALGLTGLFLTGDVFSFYVFFELAMIAGYALAASDERARQLGGAFIFAVVNLLGSFVFLIAVGALYRATGTLEMVEVAARAAALDPNTAVLIAVTFFIAFGVKLGLFPFHFWVPTVYASASPAVAAMLSGALANIGAYGLLRFGGAMLPRPLELGATALVAIGTISIAYGSLQAVARRDTREVLAYSAIGNAGYMLVALGLGGAVGLTAAVVFSVINAINKALLFLGAELRGPLMATAFIFGAFSVAGVPPFAGFFGKAALLEAGIDARSAITVALLFVGSALAFVYLFQIFQNDYWRPEERHLPTAPPRYRVVTFGLALLLLGLGIWPEPLLAIAEQAGNELWQGSQLAAEAPPGGGEP